MPTFIRYIAVEMCMILTYTMGQDQIYICQWNEDTIFDGNNNVYVICHHLQDVKVL